jgi:hypothetical protein
MPQASEEGYLTAGIKHPIDNRSKDDFHGKTHLPAWNYEVIASGHKGSLEHRKELREIDIKFLGVLKAYDDQALVWSGDARTGV